MSFIIELWEYLRDLRERKKYWIIPILLFLLLFGAIVIVSEGSAVAPLIYTIFWSDHSILNILNDEDIYSVTAAVIL